jgi:N-acetylneuraminic acid mutarotase
MYKFLKLSAGITILTIFSSLLSTCSKDDPPGTIENNNQLNWEATTPFPGYIRKSAAGFWIGDNFYTGLGWGYFDDDYHTGGNLNDFYEYNTLTKIWTKKADFPDIGRFSVVAFSVGNKGYIGFGQSFFTHPGGNTLQYKDLWEFDPSLDIWTKIGTYTQVENGATLHGKSYVVNGKVYITLGFDLWVFDSYDKTLIKIGLLPESMIITTGFEINGKIYIGTGGIPPQDTFYEFNPSTNTWTKKADFPGPTRRFASGFALKGKGYLSCGEGQKPTGPNSWQSVGLIDTWQYDPVSDVWTKINDYPGNAFIDQVSSNSGSKACIGTGHTQPGLLYGRDFWIVR